MHAVQIAVLFHPATLLPYRIGIPGSDLQGNRQ